MSASLCFMSSCLVLSSIALLPITTSAQRISFPESCGGIRNTTTGTIQSPNYPNPYPHNVDCSWQIIADAGQRVTLSFRNFQTEYSNTCGFDYVRIDGATSSLFTDNSRYCGRIPAHSLFSVNNTLTIRFRSDGSSTFSGFELNYISMDADSPCFSSPCQNGGQCSLDESSSSYSCNCTEGWDGPNCTESSSTFSTTVVHATTTPLGLSSTATAFPTTESCGGILNTTTGTIQSPNYPNSYPHNVDCTWQIIADAGQRVTLSFRNFQTEDSNNCGFDYVRIDGATSSLFTDNSRYCGQIPAHSLSSVNNTLTIRFRSDGSSTFSGFELNYISLDADSPCFSSPCQNGGQCSLDESSSSYSCNCTERWDGPSCTESSSTFSTTVVHATTTSLGLSSTATAFTTTEESASCGGILNATTGTIQSPNYPNLYPDNVDCTWQIIAGAGQRVTLSFRNFQIENSYNCVYESVRISGSASSRYTRNSKYCGIIPDHTLISTNNSLTIQFRTSLSHIWHLSNRRDGFELDYEVVVSDSPCYYSPCQNGGRCSLDESSSSSSYYCYCPEGWGGSNCTESNSTFTTQAFDETTTKISITTWQSFTNTVLEFTTTDSPCYDSPCQNGGRCSLDESSSSSSYFCNCTEGWGGSNCTESNSTFPTQVLNETTTAVPGFTTRENNFLSYGTQTGDHVHPLTDDACLISFDYDLVFYGTTYNTLFVCTNGVLSFPVANPSYTPESFPLPLGNGLIAPYWTDLYPGKRGLGNVYARYTTNAEHLRQASQLVQEGFRIPFIGDRMVVATWDNLPAFLESVRGEVRFQCLLITDDYRGTYVVYLYDYLGFHNGYTGSAQVGFDAGNGRTFYAVQGSRSSSIVNLVRTSNVGKPGIWMFNLGADTIGTPPDQDECTNPSLNNCPYSCVDLASGYVCTCPSEMFGDGYNCNARTNNTVIQEESYCNDSRLNNCPYECMDLPGGFTCKCPSGYDGDGFTCAVRINECANSSINACPYACTDLPIGYRCDCFFGFVGDGYNCRVDNRTNWSNSTWLIGNSTSDDSSVLGCPTDYAVHLPSSLSSIRVTWSLPEIADGESLSCVSCPHNSRAFTIGNHTINYQYRSSRYPYRIYGCSFEIAVLGSQSLHLCRQNNETRLVTGSGEKTATFITDEGYDKTTTIELHLGSHEIYTNFSSGLVCMHTVHVFDSEPKVQYVGLMAAYSIECNKIGTIEMQIIMSFVYHKVTELTESCPGCQISVLSPQDIHHRCTDFQNQTDVLKIYWKTNLEIPAANTWSQESFRLRYIESLISRIQTFDPTGRLLEITVISLTAPLLSPMTNPRTGLYLTPELVSTCQSEELVYNAMTGLCELT